MTWQRRDGAWRQRAIWGVVATTFVAVPVLSTSPYWLSVWTIVALNAVVVVALDLLFGWAGQLSLGHGVFVTIGAYSTALLTTEVEIFAPLAALCGMLLAAVLAIVVGGAILRLHGYYLAMVTLGMPIILQAALQHQADWTGGSSGVAGIDPVRLGGLGQHLSGYVVAAGLLAVVAGLVVRLGYSPFGTRLRAISNDEEAAASRGVPTDVHKIAALVISAVLAAAAGSVFAHVIRFVAPSSYGLQFSIIAIVMLIIGGRGVAWGGIVGAGILTWLPQIFSELAELQPVVYGLALLLMMLAAPGGLASLVGRGRTRTRLEVDDVRDVARKDEESDSVGVVMQGTEMLVATDLRRSFGGVRAVDGVDLVVRAGTIHGIIGPNGAGKSTLLNLLAGQETHTSGTVVLDGEDLTRISAHRRTRAGLSRSYQHVRVFEDLSVQENVVVGASNGGRNDAADANLEAASTLKMVRLGGLSGAMPHDLTHYQRRMLELACAIASGPRVLLLDEPAGGLAPGEVDDVVAILRTLRTRGVAVVLVDHVLELIREVCDEVTVMHYGRVIANGPVATIFDDPDVREAYLGPAVVS